MKNGNHIFKTAAIILIIAALFAFCSCGKSSSMKKGIQLNFSGPDGHATASVELDKDILDESINAKKAGKYLIKLTKSMSSISDDYDELKGSLKSADPEFLALEIADNYSNGLFSLFYDTEISDNSGLSNGDEITVKIVPSEFMNEAHQKLDQINKALGVSVPEELKMKVEGLEEVTEIDIFADTSKIVEFSGANKHGRAVINIAEDFKMVNGGLQIVRDEYDDDTLTFSYNGNTIGDIEIEIEENQNIASGDKLNINIDYDYKEQFTSEMLNAGYVLKSETAQVIVPELENATEYDILSKVKDYVNFSGANGYGKAYVFIPDDTKFNIGDLYFSKNYNNELKVIYDNREIGTIMFKISEGGSFTKGDTAELSIERNTTFEYLGEKNIYPASETAEITVPDLGKYIDNASELTKEDIKYLKDYALKKAADKVGKPVTAYAVYFGKIKEDSAHKYTGKGVVKVVYYYERTYIISTTTVGESYNFYDISKDSEGNIRFGASDTTGCSSAETLVDDFDQNYTYTKIG